MTRISTKAENDREKEPKEVVQKGRFLWDSQECCYYG